MLSIIGECGGWGAIGWGPCGRHSWYSLLLHLQDSFWESSLIRGRICFCYFLQFFTSNCLSYLVFICLQHSENITLHMHILVINTFSINNAATMFIDMMSLVYLFVLLYSFIFIMHNAQKHNTSTEYHINHYFMLILSYFL